MLRALPADPPLALLLACATRGSMRWMLQAAGVEPTGLRGAIQVRGLFGGLAVGGARLGQGRHRRPVRHHGGGRFRLAAGESLAAWLNVRSSSAAPAAGDPRGRGDRSVRPAAGR